MTDRASVVAIILVCLMGGSGCSGNSSPCGECQSGFVCGLAGPHEWQCTRNTGPDVRIRIPQNLKNQVDLLFMVDNSNSMDAMSLELRNRFGQFFKVFSDLAQRGTFADLHIGVVTADYGAGAGGAPGCSPSPGGQAGKLVAVGAAADGSCKKPLGENYVQYAFTQDQTNPNNLPQGQDLVKTFTCMASTGSNGCGFEHQLESVYAALHNNLPENEGFVRDGALLTVVFLTNEDDCSAPPTSDLFDKNKTAQYGYEDSYRCTRFGLLCGGELAPYADSGGPLSDCIPAPNINDMGPGKLYDVSRYINFFTKVPVQGGIKTNPLDVVLVGIDAPADPVQVILSNPSTVGGVPYPVCDQLNEGSNPPCVPVLQHSCMSATDSRFFGDPAVRINAVINAASNHDLASICENDYSPAMAKLANLIASSLGGGCIPATLPTDEAGKIVADCVVEEVTQNPDGTVTRTEIPSCTVSGGAVPCWRVEVKDACSCPTNTPSCVPLSPQGLGLTIEWGGGEAPPNTTAQVECATAPAQ